MFILGFITGIAVMSILAVYVMHSAAKVKSTHENNLKEYHEETTQLLRDRIEIERETASAIWQLGILATKK